jgi:hypothetical protein
MTLLPEDYNPEFPLLFFGRLLRYARSPLNAIVPPVDGSLERWWAACGVAGASRVEKQAVTAEKLIASEPQRAAVSGKIQPEASVACFQDPGTAVGRRWDYPGTNQKIERFAGRRMGLYSEPLEDQNGNSSL